MSFEELISTLNKKFAPYILNREDRRILAKLYNKFPEDLLTECIGIGMRKYLMYDGNNHPREESIQLFLSKLGGVLHNQSRPPVYRAMNHIEIVGWRKFLDWDIYASRQLMSAYVKELLKAGKSEEEAAEELRKDAFMILYCVKSWKEWVSGMQCYMKIH